MPSIYLQDSLTENEIFSLKEEFPEYEMIFHLKNLFEWSDIEVMFGSSITEMQLKYAHRLKWIQCSGADLDGLCISEIKKRGDVMVTSSKGANVAQIAEYVMGSILAFAKQFFHWNRAPHDPSEFWNWPLKETMWSLKNKVLLQIGLGEVGSEIVRLANFFGIKSWGVRRQESFHPYCSKTFPLTDLHSLLPAADIVVLALPKSAQKEILFKEREFQLMKKDSLFIVIGSADWIDEDALAKIAVQGKFRGVVLDAFKSPPPAKDSPLWEIPNVLMTPNVSSAPEKLDRISFRIFRKNFRLFTQGKIKEMKNSILL